ncbi:ATP synthase subunit I [Legionella sp. W10-070]|uniref:ATP synthase subunit I n=1 Tax=unclassified Legionella TaxID=2622702 RepID=UPI001F5FC927|nr:ATP synthase subunit I [Legionella sp. W10-070]MDI9818007.1 ATP synthase subunit I [Legionella sp. PL877]
MKNKRGISGVKRLLMTQLILSGSITLGLMLVSSGKQAMSAMLGGLVAIIPAALFARKLFRYQGARAARQIVKGFYLGEALKILSSIILFILVFLLFSLDPIAFFFTYILVLMTHWFAPLFFANK